MDETAAGIPAPIPVHGRHRNARDLKMKMCGVRDNLSQ